MPKISNKHWTSDHQSLQPNYSPAALSAPVARENLYYRPCVVAIQAGFYFFGFLVPAEDGYLALRDAAMFAGFDEGHGVPGVCRGDPGSSVKLDRYENGQDVVFPLSAVLIIMPSVNLYALKTTELR